MVAAGENQHWQDIGGGRYELCVHPPPLDSLQLAPHPALARNAQDNIRVSAFWSFRRGSDCEGQDAAFVIAILKSQYLSIFTA